ncbi:hypothetical protein F3J16_17645 [Burkholderia sp. Ap-962]|uniref:hypothetical protein n=1 Tax=Burkholderia sp. Ap-962 TaxID=2608333 RepID=UPI0014200190|nr:hypothetical protein [Burkholderia sp. Ap-962]NIF71996.1 hypothetical protein [Burkholderia sp. Ap-962]
MDVVAGHRGYREPFAFAVQGCEADGTPARSSDPLRCASDTRRARPASADMLDIMIEARHNRGNPCGLRLPRARPRDLAAPRASDSPAARDTTHRIVPPIDSVAGRASPPRTRHGRHARGRGGLRSAG